MVRVSYKGCGYEIPPLELAVSYVIGSYPPIYVAWNGTTGLPELVSDSIDDLLLQVKERLKANGGTVVLRAGEYVLSRTFPDEDVYRKILLSGEGRGTVVRGVAGVDPLNPSLVRVDNLVWYGKDGGEHDETLVVVTEISDGSVTPAKLSAVNLPSENTVPFYHPATGKFNWVPTIGGVRSTTKVVAASDSIDKSRADYVCDGTDDQAEINAAITALGATGGTVLLLEGTYSITGRINLASNVTLMGQGAGTVLRIPNGFNADLNVIYGYQISRAKVTRLRVDGNRANQTAGYMDGVLLDHCTNCEVVGCRFENLRHYGVHLVVSAQCVIASNICVNNGSAIQLETAGCDYNVISGNVCLGGDLANNWYGIVLEASSHNTVVGNVCKDLGCYGIYLAGASEGNVVVGNFCWNAWRGIYCDGGTYSNISGNVCRANFGHGIQLTSAANYITVSGNSVQGNGGHGIYLTNSSNHDTVAGNTVGGNSLDGICIDGGSTYNLVQGNSVRHQGKQRYGINISSSGCAGNLVLGNDLYQAGQTADYNDAGTGTVYHDNRTTAGWVLTMPDGTSLRGVYWGTMSISIPELGPMTAATIDAPFSAKVGDRLLALFGDDVSTLVVPTCVTCLTDGTIRLVLLNPSTATASAQTRVITVGRVT
jgi:parallel beta-helix repeat protein